MNTLNEKIRHFSGGACVSGSEEKRLAEIKEILAPEKYVFENDKFGSLIVSCKGAKSARVSVIVPVDTAGFYITRIEEDGSLCIGAVGELPRELSNLSLISEGGVVGTLSAAAEKVADAKVFIGAHSRTEAEKSVFIGETLAVHNPVKTEGDTLVGANLSVGAVLALAVDVLLSERPSDDIAVIFATQCAAGMRGARCATHFVGAPFTVLLGAADAKGCTAGDGAVIVAMDPDIISDRALVRAARETAKGGGVKAQIAVIDGATPYRNLLSLGRDGCRLLKIAIPVKDIKSTNQSVNIGDVNSCKQMLTLLFSGKIPFERIEND